MDTKKMKNEFLAQLAQKEIVELYNFLPDVYFFMKNLKGQFVALNQAFLKHHGCDSEDEMIGKTDYDFHTPYQAERYIEEDHKVIESGSALPNQIWLVPDFKGTLKWFLSTKIPMFDLKRKVIGIAGVMRDYENVGAVLGQYQDMSEVIQFIMDHYREKIPVATLAKISHLSVSQFDRKFKQLFKCTPTTYITQIRINIACQDLVRTDDNLSLIAQRAGFYDHSYFIKQFKSIIGLTPKAYREKFNRPE